LHTVYFSQSYIKEVIFHDFLVMSHPQSEMFQRESRNLGKKKLEMLCDKILRVVHLDQRFRV